MLTLLSDAAGLLDGAAASLDGAGGPRDGAAERLVAQIARGYPDSLERRPGQLVRGTGATTADLTALVRAAGFADLDDARDRALRETRDPRPRRTARPPTSDRPDLDAALRSEQVALVGTLAAARASGALELAAAAILGSRRRWVFGDLRSRGYAQLFADDLSTALGQVVLVDPTAAGVLAAAGDAQRRDSLTVFTFRRYSKLTVRLTEQFVLRGATVVAVTDDETGPVARAATHVLRVVPGVAEHSPTAAVALGHTLARLASAGAKGATRRAEQERAVAAELQWYADA